MFARVLPCALAALLALTLPALAQNSIPKQLIFDPGALKPTDSTLRIKAGDKAPDFDLPGIDGKRVRLKDYLGVKNVVISFVPAAWTPVCSGQWPGYNLARSIFEGADAVLVGVSCDNLPSLHAWVVEMGGLWFPVASDFWPHGKLAESFGVLRSDGVSERALFVIDKQGVVRFAEVTDINSRPDLAVLAKALEQLR